MVTVAWSPIDPASTATQGDTFVYQPAALNIPVTVEAFGAGGHAWPCWQLELSRLLPCCSRRSA